MTDNHVLYAALNYAQAGWPVFPCRPGRKQPATPHGYLDATTDPAQIGLWFTSRPDLNIAVATGAPGPDILDIDHRGPEADGFPALQQLQEAGLVGHHAAVIQTPGGGFHLYFAGSEQSSSHLPGQHVDFLAQGGYALIPPSRVRGRRYECDYVQDGHGPLDWNACVQILAPERTRQRQSPQPATGTAQVDALARWLAGQREGNRNAGLFWAANRALDADQAADLSPLASAARQVGLDESEVTRTLESARRTSQARPRSPGRESHPEPPDREAEGEG
jgi:Bifunctional DNA primase/polymerase, N-terminal